MDTLADPPSEVIQSLAVEVLRRFGEARLRLMGTSMLCAVWPGDLVAVRRQGMGEIRRGHVVLFVREGRLFAHRVVGKIHREDRTLLENDPPVSAAELLGRVTGVIRGSRCLVPGFTIWRRIGSWLLCRSELGTRLALRLGSRSKFTWACTPRVQASRRGALAGPLPAIGTLRRPLSTAPMPIPPIPQPCGRRP